MESEAGSPSAIPVSPGVSSGALASAIVSDIQNILDMLPVGVHIENSDLRSIFVNESYVGIFGYSLDEITAPEDWWVRAYPDPAYRDLVQRQWFEAVAFATANDTNILPQEWIVTCKNGERKVVQFHLRRVGDLLVHVYIDVSARHRLEHELRLLANTDALTGVANRRRFFEVAAEVQAAGRRLSVLVFDLDRFKAVNDGYGHAAGDQVLVDVASRCRAVLDEEQLLARLGGEEFGVLLPACDQPAAAAVAERLRAVVARSPIVIASSSLEITISVGVACAASDGVAFDTLLVRADRALYAAKRAGRNQVRVEAV